ncbi:MAG: hypothetical protein ABIS86_13560, partial [Streptosporangiaceae bacterium]
DSAMGRIAEIDRLTVSEIIRLNGGVAVPHRELRETGRGLVLVAALCDGRIDFSEHEDVSLVRWLVPGCECGVRPTGG